MTIRKASQGQRYRPSIAEQHALADLVNNQQDPINRAILRRVRPLDLVKIKNESGAARSQFDVLGIKPDGLVVTPTENEQDQRDQRFVFRGLTPAWPDHIGRWAILLEEIADNAIGLAAVGGVYACQIEKQHADHDRADIPDNDEAGGNGKLWSGFQGAAEILAAETGTGTKWAVVRLGTWDSPHLKGVTENAIPDGSSDQVTVERNGSSSESIKVYNNHLNSGQTVPAAKDVEVYFHRDEGRWVIVERAC